MENVRKHRDIKLVTTERRRNYLVSEPNYHTAKFFTENLLAIEMNKTQILMNKFVYLGLLLLYLSKTVNVWILVWLHKTKMWWKCKTLLYGHKYPCFIAHIKTWYLQRYCRKFWKKTWNFKLWNRRTIIKRKNKKVIGLMKDELVGQITGEFIGKHIAI